MKKRMHGLESWVGRRKGMVERRLMMVLSNGLRRWKEQRILRLTEEYKRENEGRGRGVGAE